MPPGWESAGALTVNQLRSSSTNLKSLTMTKPWRNMAYKAMLLEPPPPTTTANRNAPSYGVKLYHYDADGNLTGYTEATPSPVDTLCRVILWIMAIGAVTLSIAVIAIIFLLHR